MSFHRLRISHHYVIPITFIITLCSRFHNLKKEFVVSLSLTRNSSRNRYQTDLYAEDDQWSDSSSLKGSQTSLNYTSKE